MAKIYECDGCNLICVLSNNGLKPDSCIKDGENVSNWRVADVKA